jgi:integrase
MSVGRNGAAVGIEKTRGIAMRNHTRGTVRSPTYFSEKEIERLETGETAKMPLRIHPHMLRHACGCRLANDG